MFLNVWSLVCKVAAFMLANNIPNKYKARLSLLWETYIWGHTKVYLKHLFDVLWEAYLHTEEALCKAQADQPDFSASLLQTSKSSAKSQWFHTVRESAHLYSKYQISPKTSRCVCVVRVSLQSCVIVTVLLKVEGQVLEFGKTTKAP